MQKGARNLRPLDTLESRLLLLLVARAVDVSVVGALRDSGYIAKHLSDVLKAPALRFGICEVNHHSADAIRKAEAAGGKSRRRPMVSFDCQTQAVDRERHSHDVVAPPDGRERDWRDLSC